MKIRERSLWIAQIVTGLLLVGLLGLHMGIMHLNGVLGLHEFNPGSEDPLHWGNVTHRAGQMFFVVTYVLLLAAGLFHGLNGLRNILFELGPSARWKRRIVAALVVVGTGFLVLGTWAATAARTLAAVE